MKRYAAFLRGVMPTNCKMPDLKKAFESAGFEDVKTLLGSGNVVFRTSSSSLATLERAAETAMKKQLGRVFTPFIRPVEGLRALLEAKPFDRFDLDAKAKRVVTFLKVEPKTKPKLPIDLDEARILAVRGAEVLSAYVPGPKGPVFMTLIEKNFGKELTTRTWDTVAKVAK